MHALPGYKFRKILTDIHIVDRNFLPVPPSEFALTRTEEECENIIAEYAGVPQKYSKIVVNYLTSTNHRLEGLNFVKHFVKHADIRLLQHPSVASLVAGAFEADLGHPDGDEHRSMGILFEAIDNIPELVLYQPVVRGHHDLDQNIHNYLQMYCALTVLGMDVSTMEYWDFFRTNYQDNLAAIGVSHKEILRRMIRKLKPEELSSDLLRETMTMKYLTGLGKNFMIDVAYSVFSYRCARNLTTHLGGTEQQRLTDAIISSIMRAARMPDEYEVELASSDNPVIWSTLWFWLMKHQSWAKRGSRLMINGEPVYVHHHTAIRYFVNEMANRGTKPKCKNGVCYPNSTSVKPSEFFKKYLWRAAKDIQGDLKRKYKGVKFPELPENFKTLNPDNWRHINNPIELFQEGVMMSHCVGGDHFIKKAMEGDLYFHFNDGSDYGITVELLKNGPTTPPYVGVHWDNDTDDKLEAKGFTIGQVYGKHNDVPATAVMQAIADDLRGLNTYRTPHQESYREKANVNFTLRHPQLEPYTVMIPVLGRRMSQPNHVIDYDWGDGVVRENPELVPDRGYFNRWTAAKAELPWSKKASLLNPTDVKKIRTHEGDRSDYLAYIPRIYSRIEVQLGEFSLDAKIPLMQHLVTQLYFNRLLYGFESEIEICRDLQRFIKHGVRLFGYDPRICDHLTRPPRKSLYPQMRITGMRPAKTCFEIIERIDDSWLNYPTPYLAVDLGMDLIWDTPSMKKVFGHNGVGYYILHVLPNLKPINKSEIIIPTGIV